VAYAYVGVSTVDRAGNEGPISTPVTVAVAHATPPAPPAPATGPVYATRADYHGKSRYTLTIEPTEPGLIYDVYRALDASVFALAGQTAGDDPALLALADQHPDAFTRLETRDAAGAPLTGTGGALSYTDVLPGTGRNRFVYKVQAVDKASNRSPLSAGLVVRLIDVVPPRAPVLTRVYGGDRQILLSWAKNREPDLALYRLYRTEDGAGAADVRTMALVTAFVLDGAGATAADLAVDATAALIDAGDGQLSYADAPPAVQTDTYYRLVAVDVAGNASPASRPAMGRAYDAAPSLAEPALES
jgi:hypothetical protein